MLNDRMILSQGSFVGPTKCSRTYQAVYIEVVEWWQECWRLHHYRQVSFSALCTQTELATCCWTGPIHMHQPKQAVEKTIYREVHKTWGQGGQLVRDVRLVCFLAQRPTQRYNSRLPRYQPLLG